MIKQASSKAWSEQIPHAKTDNLQKVTNIAQKTLLGWPALQSQVRAVERQRVHELLNLKREETESCDLIDRGLVTKCTSLMVHHYHEDKKEPNPVKLRRAMRKYRALLQSLADKVQRAIWKWSSEAATF